MRRPTPDRRRFAGGALATSIVAYANGGSAMADGRAKTTKGGDPLPTVVPFDAIADLDEAKSMWTLSAHAWAYKPVESTARKAIIARLFKARYGLEVTPDIEPIFDQRINLLLSDNTPGVRPWVEVASERVQLPPTAPNGHTDRRVPILVYPAVTERGARLPLVVDDDQGHRAQAHFIAREGTSVISDIDDTVKDTGVLDGRSLWRSTFYAPFKAVPGMATLLARIAGPQGAVHYVSSSPWHLYTPLREWLAADGFPVSSLHLKQIRLKDSAIFDILKSPADLKPPVIAGILQRYPRRKFTLVGDSGEKDPEIYADIARRFRDQVTRILIRRAPGDDTGRERFKEAFAGLDPGLWSVFEDARDVIL